MAKRVTIARKDLRVLGQMLEGGDRTYSRQELRTLDRALEKLDGALGAWGRHFTTLGAELRRRRAEKGADGEALAAEESRRVQALNEAKDAEETVGVLWEDAEFDLVKAKWASIDNFLGNRDARRFVAAVDDALEAAEPVDVQKAAEPVPLRAKARRG